MKNYQNQPPCKTDFTHENASFFTKIVTPRDKVKLRMFKREHNYYVLSEYRATIIVQVVKHGHDQFKGGPRNALEEIGKANVEAYDALSFQNHLKAMEGFRAESS